jgi:hypothetical protein
MKNTNFCGIASFFYGAALLAVLGACSVAEPSYRELARLRSIDGSLDAVLMEIEVNATVSTPYLVFIVASGLSPEDQMPVLKLDKSRPPKFRWAEKDLLVIECAGSRVLHFQSFDVVRLKTKEFVYPRVSIDCAGVDSGSAVLDQ